MKNGMSMSLLKAIGVVAIIAAGCGSNGSGDETATDTNTAVSTMDASTLDNPCAASADPASGGALPSDMVTGVTFHANNGEILLNATIDQDGNTTACGSLESDIENPAAPKMLWQGISTKNCLFWYGAGGGAPNISGTGMEVNVLGTPRIINGSDPLVWGTEPQTGIVACGTS